MIEYSRIKKIHFVGIGGAGMSGIAEVLHNMGFTITGSDIAEGDTVKRLKRMGIKVYLGHHQRNVSDAETLVYSSAVTMDNQEVKTAIKRAIPVISRAEMLAELMRVKFSVAVAGTHGKTTTTSMISTVLSYAGKDPTFVVGGRLKIGESGAKLGKSDYLIAEADESDGSFLRLFPTISVVTNIEDDHLDHYQNIDRLKEAFLEFGNKVPFYGSVIVNYDCENCRKILSGLNKKVTTFGLSPACEIRGDKIQNSIFGANFDLIVAKKKYGRITLNVGGIHNVYNALAAVATALEIGIDFDTIREGLEKFYLPDRRFQVLFYSQDYLVVDDYAHHPTEIKVTLETLKLGTFNRIIAVFQPHRFTRLQILMDDFAGAFGIADKLIITKIYAASQAEIENVTGDVLAEKVGEKHSGDVLYIEEFADVVSYLKRNLQPGDALVFLSAGDLTRTAHQFAGILEELTVKRSVDNE